MEQVLEESSRFKVYLDQPRFQSKLKKFLKNQKNPL